MARTNTYLNFTGKTEEAFNFYRVVFGTEFAMPIQRMSDVPASPGVAQLSDAEKKLVMHVELPIVGGHILMGTDALESMGHKLVVGTNVSISLEPDTREETKYSSWRLPTAARSPWSCRTCSGAPTTALSL